MKIRVVHGVARRNKHRNLFLENNNKTLAERLDKLNISGINKKKVELGTGLLNGVITRSGRGDFKIEKQAIKKKLRF